VTKSSASNRVFAVRPHARRTKFFSSLPYILVAGTLSVRKVVPTLTSNER
jgi:hypothetical protein